ncbi:MAG: DUF2148 domain-containing protein [Candidatus Omnitrophota bacterium]
MGREYKDIAGAVLKDVAEFMCAAARTAPKAKGVDNLVITILDEADKQKVIQAMEKLAAKDKSRPGMVRDAKNIKKIDHIIVIGTEKSPLGLNCGFCGYPTCEELSKTNGVCSYSALNLGIALGSAVSIASKFHIDNRMMYSIGKAAMESGVLGKTVSMAVGIPLSATGKNPFFDR